MSSAVIRAYPRASQRAPEYRQILTHPLAQEAQNPPSRPSSIHPSRRTRSSQPTPAQVDAHPSRRPVSRASKSMPTPCRRPRRFPQRVSVPTTKPPPQPLCPSSSSVPRAIRAHDLPARRTQPAAHPPAAPHRTCGPPHGAHAYSVLQRRTALASSFAFATRSCSPPTSSGARAGGLDLSATYCSHEPYPRELRRSPPSCTARPSRLLRVYSRPYSPSSSYRCLRSARPLLPATYCWRTPDA
ncbi:hypothetical protein B0H14DRAFT_259852 [Mycena olivaceomarginata]|nr:hypothetical protein B0H14DRAFT_259852 [Mycena olivaceomarginata]